MDMLILFMLFSSITPLLLWSRRKSLALIQLPLITGMWLYFWVRFIHVAIPAPLEVLLVVLFFGNLLYTEFALIRACIDFGNSLKKNARSQAFIK